MFIHALPEQCQNSTYFEQISLCAKKYFMIQGEPINPLIIHDLVSWFSDDGEQVEAINLLDSQKSNRYFIHDFNIEKNKKYFYISGTHWIPPDIQRLNLII